jgi:hypothetical protein
MPDAAGLQMAIAINFNLRTSPVKPDREFGGQTTAAAKTEFSFGATHGVSGSDFCVAS